MGQFVVFKPLSLKEIFPNELGEQKIMMNTTTKRELLKVKVWKKMDENCYCNCELTFFRFDLVHKKSLRKLIDL